MTEVQRKMLEAIAYLNRLSDPFAQDHAKAILAYIDSLVPFSQLSPAETERLALLVEECGESVQAIGKILRHGYESRHPDGGPTNREALARELGDVEAAKRIACLAGDLDVDAITSALVKKMIGVSPYLHHQDKAA